MKNLWKTCEICEGLFQANRSSQRFCPECGKDSAKARRRLERAEQINRSKIGDGNGNLKPQKAVCKECGKEFFSIYGISYCSSLCQYSARVQETRCPVCGKNLFSLGIESGKDIPCSPECRNVYDIRKAKEKGRYKTCLQCGKAFIAHNKKGRFCCQDCWRTYAKAHKKSHTDDDTPSRKKESDAYDKKTCRCCGRTYILSDAWQSEVFCSPSCRDRAKPKIIRHIPPCRALEQSRQQPKGEQKKSIFQPIHLCTTCRTSQTQCERFTSQFMYFPKGAVTEKVEEKQIVVSCPKFSATKKKI